jgi:hypothetical protein
MTMIPNELLWRSRYRQRFHFGGYIRPLGLFVLTAVLAVLSCGLIAQSLEQAVYDCVFGLLPMG